MTKLTPEQEQALDAMQKRRESTAPAGTEYERQLRAAEASARYQQEKDTARRKAGCWAWALGIIALPVVALIGIFIWAQFDPAPTDPRIGFIVACKQGVRDRLKAPSSAEFGPETSLDVQGSPGAYRLTGTIEAQNSFGVKIRTAYACTGSEAAPSIGIL